MDAKHHPGHRNPGTLAADAFVAAPGKDMHNQVEVPDLRPKDSSEVVVQGDGQKEVALVRKVVVAVAAAGVGEHQKIRVSADQTEDGEPPPVELDQVGQMDH